MNCVCSRVLLGGFLAARGAPERRPRNRQAGDRTVAVLELQAVRLLSSARARSSPLDFVDGVRVALPHPRFGRLCQPVDPGPDPGGGGVLLLLVLVAFQAAPVEQASFPPSVTSSDHGRSGRRRPGPRHWGRHPSGSRRVPGRRGRKDVDEAAGTAGEGMGRRPARAVPSGLGEMTLQIRLSHQPWLHPGFYASLYS